MSERFTAVIDNDKFGSNKDFFKVTIVANDLNVLSNVCSAINLVKSPHVLEEVDKE